MLTGADLFAKVKELGGGVSKTEMATACGYISKKKYGFDRVNFTAFYKLHLDANGIDLSPGGPGAGKGGEIGG